LERDLSRLPVIPDAFFDCFQRGALLFVLPQTICDSFGKRIPMRAVMCASQGDKKTFNAINSI
jgi:hypothetical protein